MIVQKQIPNVQLDGADVPLTQIEFRMAVDEVATIDLAGYMPTSLDVDAMLAQGERLLLKMILDNGEEMFFLGSVSKEPSDD